MKNLPRAPGELLNLLSVLGILIEVKKKKKKQNQQAQEYTFQGRKQSW